MDLVFKTTMLSQGGRNGSVQSDDGSFKLKLALPKAMGGKEEGINPEQLFAGAFAACFEHAVRHLASPLRRGNGTPVRPQASPIKARGAAGVGPRRGRATPSGLAWGLTLRAGAYGPACRVARRCGSRPTASSRLACRPVRPGGGAISPTQWTPKNHTLLRGCYVEAELGLYISFDDVYRMVLTLTVHMAGPLTQSDADFLLERAREVCPMAGATKNNVTLNLKAVLDTPVPA